jgi:hypothetical protein
MEEDNESLLPTGVRICRNASQDSPLSWKPTTRHLHLRKMDNRWVEEEDTEGGQHSCWRRDMIIEVRRGD